MALSTLQLPTSAGGFGAPNFRAYYYAGQLQWVTYWLAGRHLDETGLTPVQLNKGELNRLLLEKSLPNGGLPLLMRTARTTLNRCLSYTRETLPYAPVIPLLGLPVPTGVLGHRELEPWGESGIVTVGDLFSGAELLDFSALMEQCDLHPLQFLTYRKYREC